MKSRAGWVRRLALKQSLDFLQTKRRSAPLYRDTRTPIAFSFSPLGLKDKPRRAVVVLDNFRTHDDIRGFRKALATKGSVTFEKVELYVDTVDKYPYGPGLFEEGLTITVEPTHEVSGVRKTRKEVDDIVSTLRTVADMVERVNARLVEVADMVLEYRDDWVEPRIDMRLVGSPPAYTARIAWTSSTRVLYIEVDSDQFTVYQLLSLPDNHLLEHGTNLEKARRLVEDISDEIRAERSHTEEEC